MDKDEFVWRLYESERDFIKHHENQRTNASNTLAATAAALMVAFTAGPPEVWAHLMISVALMLVGMFGAIFGGKLYQLVQLHANRSYKYLEIINTSFADVDATSIKNSVKTNQEVKFPRLSKINLNKIWYNFHIFVFLLGFLLSITVAVDYFG